MIQSIMAIPEDLSSVPNIHIRKFTTTWKLQQGLNVSGLHWHLHVSAYT